MAYRTNRESRERRFWAKVDMRGPDDCWYWTGAQTFGYGKLARSEDGRRIWLRAHCVAYEYGNGQIPEGLCVCHTCDNPLCCNPRHLWTGTRRDNNSDRCRKGRNADNRGVTNPNVKLSEQQVHEIRAALAAGEVQQVIADRYGVVQPHISRIKYGTSWQDILHD